MEDMNFKPFMFITIGFIILIIITFFLIGSYKPIPIEKEYISKYLHFDTSETIKYTFEQCQNINRSLYINRLFKRDYRLPMCPKAYVVLFDEYQNITFIFNDQNNENPTILTYSLTCDPSIGRC